MQTRDTHQVGNASSSEEFPIGSHDGTLIAHDQCSNHTRMNLRRVVDCGQTHRNPRANELSGLGNWVKPRSAEFLRYSIAFASSNNTCRHDTAFPKPQLLIKTTWVAKTVRRFETNNKLPCITRMQVSPSQGAPQTATLSVIPTQLYPCRQLNGQLGVQMTRRLYFKIEPHTHRILNWQRSHHASHSNVLPLNLTNQLSMILQQTTQIDQ